MRTGPPLALAAPRAVIAPRADARLAVRELLAGSQDYAALEPQTRTVIAGALARIGSTALDMNDATAPKRPLAIAQNAGSEFSGAAVDRVAGTTRNILNAVSFPRFVNELITGVFKAMNDSNQQQLTSFVELIRNVAQTTDGFADANVGVSGARSWLAENFPGSYQIEGGDEVDMAAEVDGLDPAEAQARRQEIQAEQDENTRLIMRPGGQPPSESALRTALGAPDGTPLSPANPEALVPLARQVLARNRQQLLATMIQMGLQRIVIESGRVNAAMKLHVDASSAAENDRGSQFDVRNTTEGSVGAKFGPWGAEAKVQNTIGYVTTDRTSTTERLNASVDLDSGVELVFRTDYVPLSRLAGGRDVERIRVNTINPQEEALRLTAQADARARTDQARDAARERRFDSVFHQPPSPAIPPAAPTTPAAETAAPVVETAAPVAETAAPVVETAAPVAETAAPVAETAAPVAETAAPVAETAAPTAETASPTAPARPTATSAAERTGADIGAAIGGDAGRSIGAAAGGAIAGLIG